MCFASLLACFWAPCGAHLASVLGSLACPGLSWTCLGDKNVVADLDKLKFFFTMDSRGPPLTRNGAPGHPKTHQNDFKMVARGLDLWPCLCRLCGSLVFVAWVLLFFFQFNDSRHAICNAKKKVYVALTSFQTIFLHDRNAQQPRRKERSSAKYCSQNGIGIC